MSISAVSRRKCEQIAERVENENGNLGVVDVPHTKTCQNAVKIQFGKICNPQCLLVFLCSKLLNPNDCLVSLCNAYNL